MRNYGNLNILKTFYFSGIPVLRGLLLIHIQSTHCGIQNQVCLLWFFLEKKILNIVKKWEKFFCWIGEKLKTFESNTTPPLFSVVDKAVSSSKILQNYERSLFVQDTELLWKKVRDSGVFNRLSQILLSFLFRPGASQLDFSNKKLQVPICPYGNRMLYGNYLPPCRQRVRLRMNYRQHINYTYIAQLEVKEI